MKEDKTEGRQCDIQLRSFGGVTRGYKQRGWERRGERKWGIDREGEERKGEIEGAKQQWAAQMARKRGMDKNDKVVEGGGKCADTITECQSSQRI